VGHAQHDLADDLQVVVDEQVVVLDDRASQRVFDGHHGAIRLVANHGFEHLVEFALGTRLDGVAQNAAGCLFGKCPAFALKGDANSALAWGLGRRSLGTAMGVQAV
jgi:hypothetical protein